MLQLNNFTDSCEMLSKMLPLREADLCALFCLLSVQTTDAGSH